MKRSQVLVAAFSVKIALDMLLPYRELAFGLVVVLSLALLIVNSAWWSRLSSTEVAVAALFLVLCGVWYIRSGEHLEFIKYAILPIIYFSVRCASIGLASQEIASAAIKIFRVFICLFALNYVISLAVADPLGRSFFGFEHANLLGSYCLFAMMLIYVADSVQNEKFNRAFLVLASTLSTSTGAALLSVVSLFKVSRITLIGLVSVCVIALIAANLSAYIMSKFAYDYYVKLFGPLLLLWEHGFATVVDVARSGAPIQDLGEQYQSSLTWRLYAYVVFWDFIVAMSPVDLIFGLGFGGYEGVWGGMMPHNDYLFVIINYGLVGLIMLLALIVRSVYVLSARLPGWTPLVAVLIVRLALENNILSFYLLSFAVMGIALMSSAYRSRFAFRK